MKNNVIGLFESPRDASNVITSLADHGFTEREISLITHEDIDADSFAITENTNMVEGATTGAITGGVLGTIVGGLAAVGAVASGGFGVLASGPIAAALAAGGLSAGGGAMLGAVYGTVIPDDEMQYYEDELKKGGAVVGVECDIEKVAKAKQIIADANPVRVHTD